MTLLYVILAAAVWNSLEVYVFKKPILANIIGYTLAALFGYPLYHRTYTNLHVYLTHEPLFEIKVGSNRLRIVPIKATAITFGEVILATDRYCHNSCIDLVLQREFIHVDQYRKLGSIRFFVTYLWYYVAYFVKNLFNMCGRYNNIFECLKRITTETYEQIPFEVEAREKSGY